MKDRLFILQSRGGSKNGKRNFVFYLVFLLSACATQTPKIKPAPEDSPDTNITEACPEGQFPMLNRLIWKNCAPFLTGFFPACFVTGEAWNHLDGLWCPFFPIVEVVNAFACVGMSASMMPFDLIFALTPHRCPLPPALRRQHTASPTPRTSTRLPAGTPGTWLTPPCAAP